MAQVHPNGRFDRLVDWLAAAFPAACAGYAANKVGPLFNVTAPSAAVGASASTFVIAFAVMSSIRPREATFVIPITVEDGGEDELVLDQVWQDVADQLEELLLDRPMVQERSAELAELLLDDRLGTIEPNSRVVQLFAPDQLKQRIDRHLANARESASQASIDASDALSEALAELRQSLHRA